MLDVSKVYANGANAWDRAVHDASEEYKHRMVKCFRLYLFGVVLQLFSKLL